MNKNDLETINQIADYRCREYYEIVLEALIVLVIGVIVGISIFKIAPSTSSDTKSITPSEQQQNIPAGNWVKPLAKLNITSPFGMRLHPKLGIYKPHNGTDFSSVIGTPTYALFNGKITAIVNDGACGIGVKLNSGEYQAVYCHLDQTLVKQGQVVKAGETIGKTGNTGRSTGPHLHFGIKKNSQWIDPVPEMKKRGLL